MAALTTVRLRPVHWLKKLGVVKYDSLGIGLGSWTPAVPCGTLHQCYSSTVQPIRVLQQTVGKPRHCLQHAQVKLQSTVSLDVPQVDLEAERGPDSQAVNASEVLQNLGPEDARKLKIIKLEFDVMEQMYTKVPEVMTDENWLHALQLDSKSKRMRYYTYLRKVENAKKSKRKKQEQKVLVKQQQQEDEPVERGENAKSTIFFTIRDSTIKKAGTYRLAHAMQFGQPLIVDMDYEQYMRHQDSQNLVSQLLICYSRNREALDPFHLIFTSLHTDSKALRMLHHARLTGQNFMGTMTDRSYLDLFPRERLVYLSPHASEWLPEVNCDDVYIIGGIVDKTYPKPLSLARAKEQGIRTYKFPLDKYLLWGMGSKSLTLDQVLDILLEQRRTKDWNEAFKIIPQRKLYRDDS